MSDAMELPADSALKGAAETEAEPGKASMAEEMTAAVRYKPMSLPSAPFWLTLIAAVVFVSIIAATWSGVFIFAIGLALFALLLPIVNFLTRHGFGRGLASLTVVALTVLAAVVVGLFALAVFFNQFLPFIGSIPEQLAEIQSKSPDWLAGAIQGLLDGINTAVAGLDATTIALGLLKGILGLVGTVLALTMLPFFIFYLLTDE